MHTKENKDKIELNMIDTETKSTEGKGDLPIESWGLEWT